MTEKETQANEAPVFDKGKLSYRDTVTLSKLQIRLQHLDKQIKAAGPQDDIDAMLDKFDALNEQMVELMSRVIQSIPRSWIVDDAPSGIEDTAEAIHYVRADKFNQIAAQNAETENAGN